MAVALLLAGCTGPVAVGEISPERIASRLTRSALQGSELSEDARQTVYQLGLEPRWREDPDGVVAELAARARDGGGSALLPTLAEAALLRARGQRDAAPARGLELLAAASAWRFLLADLADPGAAPPDALDARVDRVRRIYNAAVSRFATGVQLPGWKAGETRPFATPLGAVPVATLGDGLDPARFEAVRAADGVEVRGLRSHHRWHGLGAALVTYRSIDPEDPLDAFRPPEGVFRPVNALLEFDEDGAARLVLRNLWRVRSAELVGPGSRRVVPLEGDPTAPYASLVASARLPSLARTGLLRGADAWYHQGLFLLESYDPEQVPLLMVHGLASSPLTWLEVTNEIAGDPELSDAYQIWHFMYPSGVPYLYAGSLLRRDLARLREALDPEGDDPAFESLVLIGHSMGGLLSRTLISASGSRLWDATFQVPPEALVGPPERNARVREVFHFEPDPSVGRVIFAGTPHRGSELADSLPARVGNSFVRLPEDFTGLFRGVTADNPEATTPAMRAILEGGGPTSIRALSPRHPLIQVLARLPIRPGLPYHTIAGDDGRPDAEPVSDGVVTLESARLAGAASELVAPVGHTDFGDPAVVAEVKRILRLHLRSR